MKYICFFDDGQYYYCYSENGKIYRGADAKSFTPNFKYFLALILTPIIGKSLNEAFQDKISDIFSVLFVLLGMTVSIALGMVTYHKIIKQAYRKLTEVFLSDAQFQDYIFKGKRKFKSQLLIVYVFMIIAVFLFALFYLNKNLLLWFLGTVAIYLLVIMLSWIKPFRKYHFYKEH